MELDLIQNSLPPTQDDGLGPNVIRLRTTDQIKELQTVLRDRLDLIINFDFDIFSTLNFFQHPVPKQSPSRYPGWLQRAFALG